MIEENYEANGDAKHYGTNRLDHLVKAERTYGTLAVMLFCEITADKYRERLGKKQGQSTEQELLKLKWYEDAAKFYFNRIQEGEHDIVRNNLVKEGLPWAKK